MSACPRYFAFERVVLSGRPLEGTQSGPRDSFGFRGTIEKGSRGVVPPTMSQKLTVEGMSCEHCEQTVEDALEGVAGVRDAAADREYERVTVEGDADPDALVAAVEDVGYDASA